MNKTLVFEDTFTQGIENWKLERWDDNEASAEVTPRGLEVKTVQGQNGVKIWCTQELPDNFLFEYDMTPLSTEGFFLIFFCYKGQDGADIFDEHHWVDRDHKHLFNKYTRGKLNGYHISYRRGDEANCNFRKNSGMALLHQTVLDVILPKDKTFHVALSKQGGHVRLVIDDKVFMDHTDDGSEIGPVWNGGRIGLRQVYDSHGLYRNVKLWDIG